MSFDFTVAIAPNKVSISKELQYAKSALLYADKVRLISPLAYLYVQLTAESNHANEKNAARFFKQTLSFFKTVNPSFYAETAPVADQLYQNVHSKEYKAAPFIERMPIKKQLRESVLEIGKLTSGVIGIEDCSELQALVKNKQVIIEKFNDLGNDDAWASEYVQKLKGSMKSSYPLFDELSNNLMRAAVKGRVINLSDIEKRKIAHAGLADNYIQRLPSFEEATSTEIVDIKKELSSPLVRFRSSLLDYSKSIQSLPWDDDFAPECASLFDREIAPAVLEIEEATKANSFVKNLGNKFFTDEGVWKTTGGLVLSIAAAGVLPSFTSVATASIPAIVTGGTIAISKIAQAHSDYVSLKKETQKKDMYFFYQAGKLLEK